MKRIFLSFTLVFSVIVIAQQSKSIVSMYCSCDPEIVSDLVDGNKIYYITNDTKSGFDVKLNYNLIEKISGQWTKKINQPFTFSNIEKANNLKYFISDFSGSSANEKFPQTKIVSINNQDYFYSTIQLYMQGTASNGINNFIFIFQDVNFKTKPIILSYERSNGEFAGNYKVESKEVSKYSDFIDETNKFVTSVFSESNDDIDSQDNFHLKWNNLNDNIFERISNDDEAYVRFVNFNSNDLYEKIKNEYEVEEIENNSYKLITGFITPTIVYDKNSDKSIVVFIPQGWPNGGAWGLRSFYPKNIVGDKIIIESDDEILTIDLKSEISDGYLSRIKKEN